MKQGSAKSKDVFQNPHLEGVVNLLRKIGWKEVAPCHSLFAFYNDRSSNLLIALIVSVDS